MASSSSPSSSSSFAESQDTSIVLSQLLANEVTKRVMDLVIDKFASSDDFTSSSTTHSVSRNNNKNNDNNTSSNQSIVLNRLKTLWKDNLAAVPGCGVTMSRNDPTSKGLQSTAAIFKSARLTDPVQLSPEFYAFNGIHLAAPYLPPPSSQVSSHTENIISSANSNSNVDASNTTSISNVESVGVLSKVLGWKQKLVPKRVSTYKLSFHIYIFLYIFIRKHHKNNNTYLQARDERIELSHTFNDKITLFPKSIRLHSISNARLAARMISLPTSSARQTSAPWSAVSLSHLLKKRRRDQLDSITYFCTRLPVYGSLIRYPVTASVSEADVSSRTRVASGRVTQMASIATRPDIVIVTVKDASGNDSIILLRIPIASVGLENASLCPSYNGVSGNFSLSQYSTVARSHQRSGATTGIGVSVPSSLIQESNTETAQLPSTAIESDDEAVELAFDSELQMLLNELEGEDDHDDPDDFDNEILKETDISIIEPLTSSIPQSSSATIDGSIHLMRPTQSTPQMLVDTASGDMRQVASIETISSDDEVYLQRLVRGVRTRIVGESTKRSSSSSSSSESAIKLESQQSIHLAPYEDPLIPIDTPDATVIASYIKVSLDLLILPTYT